MTIKQKTFRYTSFVFFALVTLLLYWGCIEVLQVLPWAETKWADTPLPQRPLHILLVFSLFIILYFLVTLWWKIWFKLNKRYSNY